MSDRPACCARDSLVPHWRCPRTVTVERDGKPYCYRHDPAPLALAAQKRALLRAERCGPTEAEQEAARCARERAFQEFAENIRDNYDCDEGTREPHATYCRACSAEKLIGKKDE